jgi:hypothetical protein
MTILYIIGAGCSRNYDQGISPVRGLKPPLNKDFFKMARKVIDHYGLFNMYSPIMGLDHLIEDITELYGYKRGQSTKVLDDDRLSLENVMNFYYLQRQILEQDVLLNSYPGDRIEALDDLLAYTIAESLSGPICSKHRFLANKMQEGDIVWNFNYDLLMDNALFAQGKLTDGGYVIRFDYTLVGNRWTRPKDVPSGVTMLKLHGSLNWLRCTSCGRFLLVRYAKSLPTLWKRIRDLRAWGQDPHIICPKCCSIARLSTLERIIVPPSLAKSYGDVEMRYLWRYAVLVSGISDLVVIGFRFAEQDIAVDMLLRNIVQQGGIKKNVPIHIVNTHPDEVKLRFKSVFPKSYITCESPESFFNQ